MAKNCKKQNMETAQVTTMTLSPVCTGTKSKQVIPDSVHATAARLTQEIVSNQLDITACVQAAGNFSALSAEVLKLIEITDDDYASANAVELRANAIASAQTVRCKAFKAGDLTSWMKAAIEEILIRHGHDAPKAGGTAVGLSDEQVEAFDLAQVKSLLNSRASIKCNTKKWPDGEAKTNRMALIQADIDKLTARRSLLDPEYKTNNTAKKQAKELATVMSVLQQLGYSEDDVTTSAILQSMNLA